MRCRATFPSSHRHRLRSRHTSITLGPCTKLRGRPRIAAGSHFKRHSEIANPIGVGTEVVSNPTSGKISFDYLGESSLERSSFSWEGVWPLNFDAQYDAMPNILG